MSTPSSPAAPSSRGSTAPAGGPDQADHARPERGAGHRRGRGAGLPEPISGWGGIDPAKGTIIERRHALYGACFTGKVLVFPSAKGSSGWAGFFQATRLQGTAPLGMVIARISAKSALGAVVTRVPDAHRP